MTHEEYREKLQQDLLGELGGEDQRALEAYLAEHPEISRETAQLRDAFAALAYSSAPIAPDAQLRANVLGQISRMKSEAGGPRAEGGASNVVPLARPARKDAADAGVTNVSRSTLRYGALAASLLIAALLIAVFVLWRKNESLQNELAGISSRLNELQGEIERQSQEQDLFTVASARVNVMNGTKVAPRASAILSFDRRNGRAIFYAYDLPQTPSGKTYQLWYIADGKPYSAGLFTVDAAGRATLRSTAPAQGLDASLFAVTLEPQGGVPSPTGDKYLLSSAS